MARINPEKAVTNYVYKWPAMTAGNSATNNGKWRYQWLSARLQYLLCVSKGDTTVCAEPPICSSQNGIFEYMWNIPDIKMHSVLYCYWYVVVILSTFSRFMCLFSHNLQGCSTGTCAIVWCHNVLWRRNNHHRFTYISTIITQFSIWNVCLTY